MKYGARVYFYDDGVIQVIQTIKRDGESKYVIDSDGEKPKEEYANPGDWQAGRVLEILRAAERGELRSSRQPAG